ncbi:Syntaxin-binding protein 3 [Xylographa carneopallida]|nr:Syntaxin-binding protein 3 [Xylographa carneopallida]
MLFNLVISHLVFASLVCATFFSDILKGLIQANRYSNLITSIPDNVIQDLESDEADAGLFVCQILNGDFPQAFEQIGGEIVGQAESDYASLTSFILSLPTLAPAILDDLVQDGEDVVSVVGELFTNPEAAVTVIVGGVESVVSDIWGGIETVGDEILCFFGQDCPTIAATTVANTGAMMLSSTCHGILANAPAPTTTPASPLTTPPSAAPSTPITAAPSVAPTDPGAQACSSAEYFTSYCESITPGFDAMPQSQQASCLCYTAYSSAAWAPQVFDDYVGACAQYLPSSDPDQAVFQGLEGFCEDAGNIYTLTSGAAQSTAFASAAPSTTTPMPTPTPTPTPTLTFAPSVIGAPVPTTQPAGVMTPAPTTANAIVSSSTTTAAVQSKNAGPADPSAGSVWLWLAPLSAVCGIMLTL